MYTHPSAKERPPLHSDTTRRRLALSTALASVALFGYGGRGAYAGSCTLVSAGTYSCSGAAAAGSDVQQNLSGAPLSVTTTAGFGISTFGSAFIMRGTDGLSFVDNYGSLISGYNNGIHARNSGGGDLSITVTGRVGGEINAIYARNDGSGALSVTATDLLHVASGYGYGIFARNLGTDLVVLANDVNSDIGGIYAHNDGSGALSVSATGKVTVGSSNGINAVNTLGTDLTITAKEVSGGRNGIFARNDGSGSLSVTATGRVTGDNGFNSSGILARNSGTDLTVSATEVSGRYYGISAHNYGSGVLSVITTGQVSGGEEWWGIRALNYGTDLTVIATDVSGGESGIAAYNRGSGSLSVTATGQVTGERVAGISASNQGTDLTITAKDAIGVYSGISAGNSGSGSLSITATGQVTGGGGEAASTYWNRFGISAYNSGTDLTITAKDVTGGESGIIARNSGSGALSVTATGQVTGTITGIEAHNINGTDLTVSVKDVSGGQSGIYARNSGSGALSIDVTGQVSGRTDHGIVASNYGTDLTVYAKDVYGRKMGISALNTGTGAVSVTTTGGVFGLIGGIVLRNLHGTDLTVSAKNVTGGQRGIYALNSGSGLLSVTLSGAVNGGTGVGVATATGAGKMTSLALEAGASISARSGKAITNDAGDSATIVKAGARVTGTIRLGDGVDALTFDGGDFSGVTAYDGGAGAFDELAFRNGAGALDGNLVTGFETVTLGDGSAVTLFNTLMADQVMVADGGHLSGEGTIVGALTVGSGGTVGPGSSAGILTVNGDLDLFGGAILDMELGGLIAGTGYDQIDVFGTATLAAGSVFNINSILGFAPATGNVFDILVADTISVGPLSSLTFNFNLGGTWGVGIFDLGGRDALRLTALAPPPATVPVPASLALSGSGLLALSGIRWLRRRRQAWRQRRGGMAMPASAL